MFFLLLYRSLRQLYCWLRLSTSVLKMTEKYPNQKAGLSGLCAGRGWGHSIGPGNPIVVCSKYQQVCSKYQQRNWARMCQLYQGMH